MFRKKPDPPPSDSAEFEINGARFKVMGPSTKWILMVLMVLMYLSQQ